MNRKPGETNKTKQEFKPNSNYEWDENQEFTVLGSELNIILKTLQIAADTPEYKRNVAIFQALTVVSNIFKEAVEQNIIREVVQDKPAEKYPDTKRAEIITAE